ncbi:MAG: hypothetical protein JST80_06705 [Bdellovibrionales bacterium]|nr:hypothetical protein [Bdellovibrionales bacterium]
MTLFSRFLLVLITLQMFVGLSYAMCPKDETNPYELQGGRNLKETAKKVEKDVSGDREEFENIYDFTTGDYAGRDFLEIVFTDMKPKLDHFVDHGFDVPDGKTALKRLSVMGDKIDRKITDALPTDKDVLAFFDALHRRGTIKYDDLDEAIDVASKEAGVKVDRYKFQMFVQLVGGAGIALKLADGFYIYSVGYGKGVKWGGSPDDILSGRGFFSEVVTTKAGGQEIEIDDPSDDANLTSWGGLARKYPDEALAALDALNEFLMFGTTKQFAKLSNRAKSAVASTISIYIPEGLRNGFDGNDFTNAWEVALEVVDSVLATFVPSNPEFRVMLKDDYLGIPMGYYAQVRDQWNMTKQRAAEPGDYSQRGASTQIDKKTGQRVRTGRSGPNSAKQQMSEITTFITQWITKRYPDVVRRITEILKSNGENIYYDIAWHRVKSRDKKRISDSDAVKLSNAIQEFYAKVQKESDAIDAALMKKYPTELPKKLKDVPELRTQPSKPAAFKRKPGEKNK